MASAIALISPWVNPFEDIDVLAKFFNAVFAAFLTEPSFIYVFSFLMYSALAEACRESIATEGEMIKSGNIK